MAIGIRQFTTNGDVGDDVHLTVPAIVGNLLVFHVSDINVGPGWAPPGFTALADEESWPAATAWGDGSPSNLGARVWWKCAEGGEQDFADTASNWCLIEFDGAYGLTGYVSSDTNGSNPISRSITPTAGVEAMMVGWLIMARFDSGGSSWTTVDGTSITDWRGVGHRANHYLGRHYAASTSGSYTISATRDSGGSDAGLTIGYVVVSAGGAGIVGCAGEPPPPVEVSVCALDPSGGPLVCVDVPDATAAIRLELDGPGTGDLWINRNSADATEAILGNGIDDVRLVRVTYPEIDGSPIFAFFLESGDFTLISSDEEGGELLHLAGRGILSYWERAIWLSEKFVVDWWPGACATPPANATGVIQVEANGSFRPDGRYRVYTVNASDEITGFSLVTVAADACWAFHRRKTYVWPNANPDGSDSKRFLVKLLTGPHTGNYFAPHQQGVVETLRSTTYGEPALLSEIGDGDKPGQVLRHMYDEATDPARPVAPISLMTVDFTSTLDSDGNAWSTSDALAAIPITVDEPYLNTIAKLLGTGVITVQMDPDFAMHAWNTYGRDLSGLAVGSGVVRFQRGLNIADQLTRAISNPQIATFAEVQGTEGNYAQALLPDAATRVPREIGVRGDTNDPTALEALGLAALDERLRRSLALTINIASRRLGDLPGDADAGYYLPGPPGSDGGDFWVGDTVTVHTGSGEHDLTNVDIRVVAITITRDEANELRVTVELSSTGGLPAISTSPALAPLASSGQTGGTTDPSSDETLAEVSSHLADTDDAHDASAISVADAGGFYTGTQVEAALQEIGAHPGDATDAHDASAISIVDAGGFFTGTEVEAALQELGAGSAGVTLQDVADAGFVGELLISDTPSTPLVFADIVQNEAQTDFVYADVPQ